MLLSGTLRYVTLRYVSLHYITLYYLTLPYLTLPYITLHYIMYNHIYTHMGMYLYTMYIEYIFCTVQNRVNLQTRAIHHLGSLTIVRVL